MDSLTDIVFLKKYDDYKITNKENIEKLIVFLNSLNVNKNYHNKKMTRYYNNRDNNIKSINKFLNKCSTSNIKKIQSEISKLINESIVNNVLESIINKCIIEPGYIDLYIKIIKNISNDYKRNISSIIDKLIESVYVEKTYTKDYDGLCEYNSSSDRSIALSLLISKLEYIGLIKNYNKSIIEKCFNKIDINDDDTTFKYINCLFEIFNINILLIHIFDDELIELKQKIKSKKTLFRLMDILDLKK